jgi:hypothetical protein
VVVLLASEADVRSSHRSGRASAGLLLDGREPAALVVR